jgi:hypothetical protein
VIQTALSNSECTLLRRIAAGRRVVEAGALLGFSTVLLASVAASVVSIDRHEDYGPSTWRPYRSNLVRFTVLAEHHDELANTNVRVALAWNTAWKRDVDGRVTLGKCKKASDLDRVLYAFDFVIILRPDFWHHPKANDIQRRALLDHELMHAAVKYDDDGEPVTDSRGRTVYRIRKHDLEEFRDIVVRYGCYKSDIEAFASALLRAPKYKDLLDEAESEDAKQGAGAGANL